MIRNTSEHLNCFDVRTYINKITSSNCSEEELTVANNQKKHRLKQLGRLYIYRSVEFTEKHILPSLRKGEVPETRLTYAGTYGNPKTDQKGDKNDCRVPIKVYSSRISSQELFHIHFEVLKYCYSICDSKIPLWLYKCCDIIGLPTEKWALELFQITMGFIPPHKKDEIYKFLLFIENPWAVFQQNDRNRVVLRSFSEDKNSEYMWEEFGAEGKGVCIEYDINQFITEFKPGLSCMNYLYPVLYSDSETDRLIPELQSSSFNQLNTMAISHQITRSLLIKEIKYEQEHEWRFIMIPSDIDNYGTLIFGNFTPSKEYSLPFIPSNIYLGPKRDETFAKEVKQAVQEFNRKTHSNVRIKVDDSLYSPR